MSELRFTDPHCHLYDSRLPGGAAEAVERARAAGVYRMVTVGCDRATSEAAIVIAGDFDEVWATVGLHPHEAKFGVDSVADLLDRPKVIAVGECGLDYYYDHSPRDVQRQAFADQIQLAHQRQLPLVVHTRDAWADTFDVLDAEGTPERTIFHCFTGGPDEADECLRRGGYLSFSGIISFKTAEELREAARRCPLERLLVETDSPYLAPVPYRGRTNQPAYVPFVASALATALGLPIEAVAEATDRAAGIAFGLPLP
jgi:TatD DNase family protein